MTTCAGVVCLRLLALCVSSLWLAGCSALNCTPLAPYLGAEKNLITLAAQIADELTQRANPTLVPQQPEHPILTTTFVNNDNLAETSQFGRILQEHITSRLVQLKYSVQEIKLWDTLLMREDGGETMLSRNVGEITRQTSPSPQAILVGTYSLAHQTLYISARLIDPVDRNILASTDYRLCMDDAVLAMFGFRRQAAGSGEEITPPPESKIDALFY